MKLTVSKDSQWEPDIYAKAPLELLLCEELHPNSKLLWIVLANQSKFGPIDKSVLDKMIGIHRSTRIRCIKELREFGLIKGKDDCSLILVNPVPILRKLIEEASKARIEAHEQLLGMTSKEQPPPQPEKKQRKSSADYMEEARSAWNLYRPVNYSKVNRMSAELLKAIDSHISSLGLKPHQYEDFFSVLKVGVEHSPFWSKENSSKNLQSITGLGSPQSKKYQNVYSLYNEGLNYDKAKAVDEADRKDVIVISAEYRTLIDDYDGLQYEYAERIRQHQPDKAKLLSEIIILTEQKMRDAKLDPAKFRMKYNLPSWPTDVPEPNEQRETFWKYSDERGS